MEAVSAWVLQMQSLLGDPEDADIVTMVVQEPRCKQCCAPLISDRTLSLCAERPGCAYGRLLSADMRHVANRLLDMRVTDPFACLACHD